MRCVSGPGRFSKRPRSLGENRAETRDLDVSADLETVGFRSIAPAGPKRSRTEVARRELRFQLDTRT